MSRPAIIAPHIITTDTDGPFVTLKVRVESPDGYGEVMVWLERSEAEELSRRLYEEAQGVAR